jgi:hypothetical protein
MLSGESAMGLSPENVLSVLHTASLRIQHWCHEEKSHKAMCLPELATALHEWILEQISISATQMGEYMLSALVHGLVSHKGTRQQVHNLVCAAF